MVSAPPVWLVGYFERLASSFARRLGITVIIHGDVAMTDLESLTITLPEEFEHETDPGRRQILEGFFDHEVMHALEEIRQTDPDLKPSRIYRKILDRFKVLGFVFNIVEDIRIEARAARLWPGMGDNIEAMNRSAFPECGKRFRARLADTTKKPVLDVVKLTYVVMAALQDRWTVELLGDMPDDLMELYSVVTGEIADLYQDPANFDDAVPVGEMSWAICERLERLIKIEDGDKGEPDPKGGKSEAQGGDESQDGQKGQKGEGPGGEGKSEKEKTDPAQPGAGEGDDTTPMDPASLIRAGGVGGPPRPASEDPPDESPKIPGDPLAALFGLVRGTIRALRDRPWPGAARYDRAVDLNAPRDPAALRRLQAGRRDLAQVAATMQTGLRRRLRAPEDWIEHDLDEGDLDDDCLADLVMGDRDVFCRERHDAWVLQGVGGSVLLDLSGSMEPNKVLLQQSALAIGDTLDGLRVPFEIIGFQHLYGIGHSAKVRRADVEAIIRQIAIDYQTPVCKEGTWAGCPDRAKMAGQGYTRCQPSRYDVVKGFGSRWPERATSVFGLQPCSDNDDAAAIQFVARRLLAHPLRARFLLVLSDGLPSTWMGGSIDMPWMLQETLKALESSGVRCGAIGINCDHVRHLYPKYRIVKDIKELAEAAISLLGEMLR